MTKTCKSNRNINLALLKTYTRICNDLIDIGRSPQIVLTLSLPVFCSYLAEKHKKTMFHVVVLSWPGIEPTTFRAQCEYGHIYNTVYEEEKKQKHLQNLQIDGEKAVQLRA